MTARPSPYAKYVSGDLSTGRLVLIRQDDSRAPCGVVIVQGVSLVDNGDDFSFDIVFDGS